MLLTETKVYTKSAMDIKGFQSFSAVKDTKSGGGLYLGIRHGLYESVMIDSGSKASFVAVCLNEKDCSVRLNLCMVHKKIILKIRIHFIMMSQFRLGWPT